MERKIDIILRILQQNNAHFVEWNDIILVIVIVERKLLNESNSNLIFYNLKQKEKTFK